MGDKVLTYPQDSLRTRRKAAPSSLNVKNHERFYPHKTFVQRRLSNSTDFDDTDIETSDSDEESLRQSLQSVTTHHPLYKRKT